MMYPSCELKISPFVITVNRVGDPPLNWRWKLLCGERCISSGSQHTMVDARTDALRALILLSEGWSRTAKNEIHNARVRQIHGGTQNET